MMRTADERNTGLLSGLPTWARVAFVLGVPSLIAVGLVSVMAGNLSRNVDVNGEMLRAIQIETRAHATETERELAEMRTVQHARAIREQELNDNVVRLLTRICLNGAESDAQRAACIAGR